MSALKDRDPRNPAHRFAALKILRQHAPVRVTPETAAALGRAGIGVPRHITVSDQHPRRTRLVGRHFFLEEGLLSPDNVIVTCAKCRIPLQIRPSGVTLKQIYCLFCAADAELAAANAKATRRQHPSSWR
jgi:hypothetical protein